METMKKFFSLLLITAFILAACGQGQSTATGDPSQLPDPGVTQSSVPDVEDAIKAYLDAWDAGDYASMYAMLTTLSRDSISQEDFIARYTHVEEAANLFQVDYDILQTYTTSVSGEIAYRVTLHSAIVGAIPRDTIASLTLENGVWKVAWDDTLILPELAGGNTLSMERFEPGRGNIFDNDGDTMVASTQAVALGVFPYLMLEDEWPGFLSQMARLTGLTIDQLEDLVFLDEDGTPVNDYVALGEVSADAFGAVESAVSGYSGIRYTFYDTRFSFDGGSAPHALGYVGSIPAEEVDNYIPLGYQSDDRIGRLGIEAWGEEYLSGTRGGILYVLNPEGQVVTQLATAQAQAPDAIYTTLDADLQARAQEAIKDFTGAIMVLERDTGRILAMASSPSFNPNWADVNNFNEDWNSYFPDDARRFFNRATQGQYPPGSIFKVVSMAAALETGQYQADSVLDCQLEWNGLPGITLEDWRLAKELPASGPLDLQEGLMRSCNPWFYEIGLALYDNDYQTAIADMARGFGLGSPTGLQTMGEQAGQIEDPSGEPTIGRLEAVQQSIGQHTTLITPLQAAVYAAALGNGGTLYQPYMIDRVENTNGQAILSFEPTVNGELPVSDENLTIIQTAMRMVVNDPRGTAYNRFLNFSVPVYGKTGTASVEGLDPHGWFIGYTDAGRSDLPDIAIAVVIENIGDGSEFAAPIFRRVASYYFLGNAGPLYPWESAFGVLDPAYFEDTPEEPTDGETGQLFFQWLN